MASNQKTVNSDINTCCNKRRTHSRIFNLIIALGLFALWLIFLIALSLVRKYLDKNLATHFFVYSLAWIQFTILLAFVAWIFNISRLIISKSFKIPLLCFTILFVFGSSCYFMAPVDRDDDVSNEGKDKSQFFLFKNHWFWNNLQLVVEAPNRTISAFFPSRGGFEKIPKDKQVGYFVFHILVLLFVAAFLFSHFGRGFGNIIRIFFIRFKEKELNVFWGLDDAGLLLAKNIIDTQDNEQIYFVLPAEIRFNDEKLKMARWKLDSLDVPWVFTDFDDLSSFDIRGHRHFFLNKSGLENLKNANNFLTEMNRPKKMKTSDVFVYVRIDSNDDVKIYNSWAEKAKKFVTPIIVSESDIIARRFIQDHPMLDCPNINIDYDSAEVNGNFKVLLMGVGSVGSSVLSEIVSNGQFEGSCDYNKKRFSVDIIEADQGVKEAFAAQHKEAMEKYNLNFIDDIWVEGPGYEAFLEKHITEYNRIIVCLAGDAMNFRIASRIARYTTDAGVGPKDGVLFAHVSNFKNYIGSSLEKITLFGDYEDVYSFDSLEYDQVDKMAKLLNLTWLEIEITDMDKAKQADVLLDKKTKEKFDAIRNYYETISESTLANKSGKELFDDFKDYYWGSKTPFLNQQASRASALCQRNLIRLLGFKMVNKDDDVHAVSKIEFQKKLASISRKNTFEKLLKIHFDNSESIFSVLARNEHLRWNAYERMLGVSCWDLKTPSLEVVVDKRANQIAKFNKHAYLVEFDELPIVDYKIACSINLKNKTKKIEDFRGFVDVKLFNDNDEISSQRTTQGNDYAFVSKIYDNVEIIGMKLAHIDK